MAVMTTPQPDGVAFEQKIQPVPSSDKMALDLDINGTSNRDETIVETASSEIVLNKSTPSPSNEVVKESFAVNGANNIDAFSSNQTLSTAINGPTESQPTESSPTSALNSSQLPDTNTTADDNLAASPGLEPNEPLTSLADSAIDSAVEDHSGMTAVPPIVEAPESDLRDTAPSAPRQISAAELIQSEELETGGDSVTKTQEGELGANASLDDFSFDIPSTSGPQLTPPTSASPAPEAPQQTNNIGQLSIQDQSDQAMAVDKSEMNDTEMADVPQAPPSKIAREREDDDEVERSAKRTKTDDEEMTDAPALPHAENGESSSAAITPYESREAIKILKNAARSANGRPFKGPVVQMWPDLAASYTAKITNPTDFAAMEQKLKDNVYGTMNDFRADLDLLVNNAIIFNGPDHGITRQAKDIRANILGKIANMPPEPVPQAKKEKKVVKKSTPLPDAPRAHAPRRESRGAQSMAAPAAVPPPAQTFALDPTTSTPLIRRDSTKGDGGRPKREIHPPKNKDLPYSVRPKNRKNATELKFCEEVMTELMKHKHAAISGPFLIPVDPVALGIPNYFAVIKKPMDLSTIDKKLKDGAYGSANEFDKDIKLMFANCFKFNPVGNHVHAMGKEFQKVYEEKFSEKNDWIADHSPQAASPASFPDSDDEEEEEEAPSNAAIDTLSAAKERLLEEQQKLITMMSAKNADAGLISMQKDMVELVQKRVQEGEAASRQQKAKKAKQSKPVKKHAPSKKAAPKKSGGNRQSSKYMGTLEKETISNGLGVLPEEVSSMVLEDIKKERPGIDEGADGTLELDIDLISVPLLWKIYNLIMKHAPEVEEGLRQSLQEREAPRNAAKPPPKKKNKPMSKHEQERKIQQLEGVAAAYEGRQSGSIEPVMQTVEEPEESSGDDSSDSEEE